jgi:hypothetical protein
MSAHFEAIQQAACDGWTYVKENSTHYLAQVEIPTFATIQKTAYNTWIAVETFSVQHGGKEFLEQMQKVQILFLSSLVYISQLELPSVASVQQSAYSTLENMERLSVQYIGKGLVELMRKVECICLNVLTYVGTALLFLSNSSVFVIGACVGVTCTETMKNMIIDIKSVFERIMREKDFTRLALMITGSVLAWPITMAACAFFIGGYYGVLMKNPAAFNNPLPGVPIVAANDAVPAGENNPALHPDAV